MTSKYCIELTAVILTASLLAIESHAQGPAKTSAPAKPAASTSKVVPATAPGMSLSEFLQAVQAKNGDFRALQSAREAAQARRESGDKELSPIFKIGASKTDDKRPQIFGAAFSLIRNESQEASMELSKKFSTGTQASVSASATETTQTMSSNGATAGTTNAFSGLGVSISQSLWKDFFGEATELRREREAMVERTETQGLNLQSRQLLVSSEAAFWDHLYLQEELQQRQDALARSKRIESWVKNRASNGIGDRADVLNAEGLVAARELELLSTQDELTASGRKLRDILELGEQEGLPQLVGNLDASRSVATMVDGEIRQNRSSEEGAPLSNQIMRLDAYLSVLEARTKAVAARETAENLKPDLKLEGAYKTNSVDSSMSGSMSNITDTNKPTVRVGLNFTYMLDDGAKSANRRTADLDALVAKQKQDRKVLESQTAWAELLRRHSELSAKIAAAQKMADLGMQEAAAERDKLSKGRSTTSTVIIAEQEAAGAQLTLAKMRAEQRKLESQARMFVQISEAQ